MNRRPSHRLRPGGKVPLHEDLASRVDVSCREWDMPLEAWQRDYLERAFAACLRERLGLTDGAS